MQSRVFILPLLLLLTLFSCDEFLLKKTVSVQSIQGHIHFENLTPRIWGDISYKIRNPQANPLKEIFLICHPQVEVMQVIYNQKAVRFETGEGFEDRIYRVQIPALAPQDKAVLTLRFQLTGRIREERLILDKEEVFFDVKKIWLPVPFAERFVFPYQISVTAPDRFYSIMGGRIQEESEEGDTRTTTWKSELDNALATGNLILLPYQRTQYKNTYIYSDTTNNRTQILQYSQFSYRILKNNFPALPLSQYHVLKKMYPYNNKVEVIDGEFLANALLISPTIGNFQPIIPLEIITGTPIPFVPNTSEARLLEIISHEYSHSLIPTLLRFEEGRQITMEALTEFLACAIIREWDIALYQKFLERNRILLINLMLKKETHTDLWQYFYLSNLFCSSFWNREDLSMDYIRILIDKYRYTDINWPQLISTASDYNKLQLRHKYLTNYSGIDTTLLENWSYFELYNFSLSSSEMSVTNLELKQPRIIPVKNIRIKSDFPFETDSYLIVYTPKETYTNILAHQKESITNVQVSDDTITVQLVSRYNSLETHLADNQVNFKDRSWLDLVNEINYFYKGEQHNSRFLAISPEWTDIPLREDDARWTSLSEDRLVSQKISPRVYFQYDKVYFDKQEFYIEAYKWINNRPYSYVIFKGRILKNKLQVNAVLDPTL